MCSVTPPAQGDPAETFVDSVSFAYGRRTVFDNLSLDLPGGVTGLLGPNGSGKTTLLNLLSTSDRPNAGRVVVAGNDVSTPGGLSKARRALGFLPQQFDLMGGVKVRANVEYAAWAQGVDQGQCGAAANAALSIVGLIDRANSRTRTLSGGMRQRLGIACAIAHKPQVLLLDEPTVGLDPDQRVLMRRYLESIACTTTVLVSTHLVEDLAMIASRVAVLAGGVMPFVGSLEEFERLGQAGETVPDRFASPLEASYRKLAAGDGALV